MLLSFQAFATQGDGKGNGGDALVCYHNEHKDYPLNTETGEKLSGAAVAKEVRNQLIENKTTKDSHHKVPIFNNSEKPYWTSAIKSVTGYDLERHNKEKYYEDNTHTYKQPSKEELEDTIYGGEKYLNRVIEEFKKYSQFGVYLEETLKKVIPVANWEPFPGVPQIDDHTNNEYENHFIEANCVLFQAARRVNGVIEIDRYLLKERHDPFLLGTTGVHELAYLIAWRNEIRSADKIWPITGLVLNDNIDQYSSKEIANIIYPILNCWENNQYNRYQYEGVIGGQRLIFTAKYDERYPDRCPAREDRDLLAFPQEVEMYGKTRLVEGAIRYQWDGFTAVNLSKEETFNVDGKKFKAKGTTHFDQNGNPTFLTLTKPYALQRYGKTFHVKNIYVTKDNKIADLKESSLQNPQPYKTKDNQNILIANPKLLCEGKETEKHCYISYAKLDRNQIFKIDKYSIEAQKASPITFYEDGSIQSVTLAKKTPFTLDGIEYNATGGLSVSFYNSGELKTLRPNGELKVRYFDSKKPKTFTTASTSTFTFDKTGSLFAVEGYLNGNISINSSIKLSFDNPTRSFIQFHKSGYIKKIQALKKIEKTALSSFGLSKKQFKKHRKNFLTCKRNRRRGPHRNRWGTCFSNSWNTEKKTSQWLIEKYSDILEFSDVDANTGIQQLVY